MNVYDFDNTIYQGDSTVDFILYCWRHDGRTLISLPRTAVCGLLYLLHVMPKRTFKQNLFHMFVFLKDRSGTLEAFVQSHKDRIKPWYRSMQQPDDLVISASPQFLIERLCKAAGIQQVLASPVDYATGRYQGMNCHGEEKVRRFREQFENARIGSFYSDSRSDAPLAKLAEKAYLVHGSSVKPWPIEAAE